MASSWCNLLQRSIDQQTAHFNQLMNRQDQASLWTIKVECQGTGHLTGAVQGFAGVCQQGFCISFRSDTEKH